MDKYNEQETFSQLKAGKSKNGAELRGLVKKIEDDFVGRLRVEDATMDEAEALRGLWLRLVSFSISEANLELAILMAAKLKLVQLALTLTSTVRRGNSLSYSMALAYVANYFRAHSNQQSLDFLLAYTPSNLTEFEHLLEFHVTACEWDKAMDLVRRQFAGHECSFFARFIYYRRAQFEEAEEEFEKALRDYTAAEAQPSDLVRVIIKQHLDSSSEVLREHRLSHGSVDEYCKKFTHNNQQQQRQAIPESLTQFIDPQHKQLDNTETNHKWLDRKRVEFLKTVVNSSSDAIIATLADESYKSRQICDLNRALSIDLVLNEMSSFVDELPMLCKNQVLECVSIYTSLPNPGYFLANFFTTNYYLRNRKRRSLSVANKTTENAHFMACIRLGLVNESLEELAIDTNVEEKTMEQAINYLESFYPSDKTPPSTLDYMDPKLESATLTKLEPLLVDNQSLTTAVISIVILSATIYLIKLQLRRTNNNNNNNNNNNSHLSRLESMFQKLSNYLDHYDFIASDTFVRCTCRLMDVVRDQLDAISDSEIIRDTLRLLVERGAGRSLMQARYRSAAKLYQLVDDNINAVKSLMRLGEMELVIKYSLLVRDVTVNRLTVNYLKHLNADPSTIEDFIAKSREAVLLSREG